MRGRGWFVLATLAAGLAGTVALGWLSEGTHHLDDITHHLIAQRAWRDARYLLHNWGRPGFTILYVPLAWAGLFGSRLTSALLSAAAAALAYLTARRMELRRAYLVPLLLYLQPMFSRLAYTSLTETALAFYLALAVWLWVTDRLWLSAVVVSLCVLTRHEAWVFLPVWGVGLVVRRRWWAVPLLLWAPAAHNVLSWVFLGDLPVRQLLHPAGGVDYGRGTLLHYCAWLPVAAGRGLVALALGGLVLLTRRRGGLILVAASAAYFGAETAIFALGAFSSGGYVRFLVPLCPLLAVAAAHALERILDGAGPVWTASGAAAVIGASVAGAAWLEHNQVPVEQFPTSLLFPWAVRGGLFVAAAGGIGLVVALVRRGPAWAVLRVAALVILCEAFLHAFDWNRPYPFLPAERGLREAARFIRANYPDRTAISFNPWYPYFARLHHPWGTSASRRRIEQAPVGTLVVWDWELAPTDHFKVTEAWLDGQWWLEEVWSWQAPEWYDYPPCVRIYEKTAEPVVDLADARRSGFTAKVAKNAKYERD